jgi:hypothetical protein
MRFVLVKSDVAPLYSELDEAARGRRDNPDCGGRPHRGRDRLRPSLVAISSTFARTRSGRQCRQASGIVVRRFRSSA